MTATTLRTPADAFVPDGPAIPSRAGRVEGVVAGMAIGWKDVFALDGHVTRAGTAFLEARGVADHPLVARLSLHGARFGGVTALTELSFSVLGENAVVPAPANPLGSTGPEARVCGGSSSGAAAAVARGLCDAAVGTDSGGSIRLPAAWYGVVGFKPTQDRRWAATVPFAPSLDTVGPIAACVADIVALHEVMRTRAGSVRADRPFRLRIPPLDLDRHPDRPVAEAWQTALDRLRAAGVEVVLLGADPFADAEAFVARHGRLAAIEGASIWRDRVRAAGDLVSDRLRRWFEIAPPHPTDTALRALHAQRAALIERFTRLLPPGDLLLTPASPIVAPTFAELTDPDVYDHLYARAHALLWPLNLFDAPAISLPVGVTGGSGIGVQIAAPQGRDADVIAMAHRLEAILIPMGGTR